MEKEYIYGINPVFEVLLAKRRKILKAFISSKNNPKIKKLIKLFNQSDISVKYLDKGELFKLSGTKQHQGVVLETECYTYSFSADLFEEPKLLLIDNIEDPHNLGAILRSAEIFAFKNILLSNKGTPEIYPSVVKVSTGATEHLNISRELSANSYVMKAKEHGYKIIALDENAKLEVSDVAKQVLDQRILLVIGGEDRSVGQFIINNADYVVKMNQFGRITSLNASVAAGIAMYIFSG